ncbi:MAG TPA: (d)CMP kinase [Flexilinea sp.]|jgi:cytidylate kinase|nr:(d)CMP kinase [Flexilinea sp.]
MKKPLQIAIDGPAASGKSTVGKKIAENLNYLFFDTGLMYRVATYAVLEQQCPLDDEGKLADIISLADIQLQNNSQTGETDVLLDGKTITDLLHLPQVDANVSLIAAIPAVRKLLTAQQRKIALQGKIVIAGRDIGTVVLPEAPLKIFLLASAEKRAERRYLENLRNGIPSDYDEILYNIKQRDQIDSNRNVAPLKPAEDAILIDTDSLTQNQVTDKIMSLIDQ